MRLQYVLGEAFRNIGRNLLVVMGAVLAVFISLSLTFSTLVFGEVARINTLQWVEDVRVIAFVQDEFRGVEQLQAEILGWEEVDDVFFVSKGEAFDEAMQLLSNQPAAKRVLEENPGIVPASLRVRPSDPENYSLIVQRLEGAPGLEDVISAGPSIDNIIALRDGLRFVFWVLAILLGGAAVALIANTIHMAIYARREEIEIMRLVGAGNWFVRTPFLLEGMIEGLVGGGLAVSVVVLIQKLAVDRLEGLPPWINISIGNEFLFQWGAVMLVFGVVVGVIGSSLSLAVHRYLRA